jgi:hypothetical protein
VKYRRFVRLPPLFLASCAAESPDNPLADYEELDASTILDFGVYRSR